MRYALILCALLAAAPASAQTIVLGATFHYDGPPDFTEGCIQTLVYVVDGMGNCYSQTPTGMHEGVPPCFEGNVWGDPIGGGARPDSCSLNADPREHCLFKMCQFITGTGDIFMQTRDGMKTGQPAQWLGNFWGPYTPTVPTTWGALKMRGNR